jgi:7-carboxy-7-deazaguanine synthase
MAGKPAGAMTAEQRTQPVVAGGSIVTFVVKEIFKTLQGEGAQAGRAAVFCRFAGCNLWSGREEDRASAICRFCDTDFVGSDGDGGGRFSTSQALADSIASVWGQDREGRFVVFTGGEPMLQLDAALLAAVRERGFTTAVETNGTIAAPDGLDWICVSPKAGTDIRQTRGHELKLVYPQTGAPPEQFERLDFQHFFLQPMDGPERNQNTELAIAYCLAHPRWRISLQTHKLMGIR